MDPEKVKRLRLSESHLKKEAETVKHMEKKLSDIVKHFWRFLKHLEMCYFVLAPKAKPAGISFTDVKRIILLTKLPKKYLEVK